MSEHHVGRKSRSRHRVVAFLAVVGLATVGLRGIPAQAAASDGTLDTAFNHGGFDGQVMAVALQSDGKILVGGYFTHFDPNGTPIATNEIARLNRDGTLDTSFNQSGFYGGV